MQLFTIHPFLAVSEGLPTYVTSNGFPVLEAPCTDGSTEGLPVEAGSVYLVESPEFPQYYPNESQ